MKHPTLCAVPIAVCCAIAAAQTAASNQQGGSNPLITARVFPYDQMTAHTAPKRSEVRIVFTGTLSTGEVVGAHESMQPAGTVPNLPHRIQHSEVMVVQQGTLEFQHDGKAERVGPGGIIYVALGTLHTIKNVGAEPAKYVVIQIGGDTKK
jgi:mannose-6-phosphate isomerase-like protein (cupin superfamily)